MPLNYLELQPKIRAYAQKASIARAEMEKQCTELLEWLRRCAAAPQDTLRAACQQYKETRCALPAGDPINLTFPASRPGDGFLLAVDGSQIVPSAHDAVPLALINIGLVALDAASGQAPEIITQSTILDDSPAGVEFKLLSEDLVSLKRDVAELNILNQFQPSEIRPVIALRDGPLELYHEPRQGDQFMPEFKRYLAAMAQLAQKGLTLAGYIDRPQSTTITQMLTIFVNSQAAPKEQPLLPDTYLMDLLLPPGNRSAIFELQSSSSVHYQDDLRLHFFYLNVSSSNKPAIARVEIPAWVARDPQSVDQLQYVLLEQCRLMGSRPYPYVLHRAHETAVVHFEEKEQLQNALQFELRKHGAGEARVSNKQAAKALQSRTRM